LAIPVHGIERLLRPQRSVLAAVAGRLRVQFAGEHLPVVSLAGLLGMANHELGSEGAAIPLLILRTPNGRLAVAVDQLLAERDALIKELDPCARHNPCFDGAVLLEGGSVALVVNPAMLRIGTSSSPKLSTGSPANPSTATADRERATILVVDDSFTTRTLETSILEAHGFQVQVAVDGRTALEKLRTCPIDLVISDVEMPNLDGFGLVAEMKSRPELARIPIVIVSSLDRPDHRQRGLDLGADAYITKQSFDHQELLQTIQQFV
jgi:two-component system chemotaxis sensor kinase CheA